ncbi:MAG: thiamine diphosphokinase [Slackia sp.]|nr:thiamine diphosphokinase [Slackia sp.]
MIAGFECALVGAADFDEEHFVRERFDSVVAVDGGYASLACAGIAPDFALGDFDSLGFVPSDVPIERHPSMKDDSDTSLALDWARLRGFSSVAVYGALGGRLDHTHATLAALLGAARRGMRVAAVGEGFVVAVLSGAHYRAVGLPASMKGTFSVYSLSDFSCGVTETGAKYEVCDIELSNDVTLGLSNEFSQSAVRIAVSSGDLAIYLPRCPLGGLVWERAQGDPFPERFDTAAPSGAVDVAVGL